MKRICEDFKFQLNRIVNKEVSNTIGSTRTCDSNQSLLDNIWNVDSAAVISNISFDFKFSSIGWQIKKLAFLVQDSKMRPQKRGLFSFTIIFVLQYR